MQFLNGGTIWILESKFPVFEWFQILYVAEFNTEGMHVTGFSSISYYSPPN